MGLFTEAEQEEASRMLAILRTLDVQSHIREFEAYVADLMVVRYMHGKEE